MSIQFQEAGVHDVSKSNPRDILYIRGNATTDGSIRIIFDPDDITPLVSHIELATKDPTTGEIIFNDTGFRFSASSVNLGFDLLLGAAGGFMQTANLSELTGVVKALIPRIKFDVRGTEQTGVMPILGKEKDFLVIPGPPDGEEIGTLIDQVFTPGEGRLLTSITHTTGSVAATSPIQISFYSGNNNTGKLLSRTNIPSSIMPANTTFTVQLGDDIGFDKDVLGFFEFISADNISLTTIGGLVVTTHSGHEQDTVDMFADELILDNELAWIFFGDSAESVQDPINKLGFVANRNII